jgi:hypothetical protein
MGCSLFTSAVPTIARSFAKEHNFSFTKMLIRDTIGTPCVIVPVLSNTIDFT